MKTKRNEKKHLISDFLLRLSEDEIQPAVDFMTGRVFPESDQRVLNVGGQTLWKTIESTKQTTLVQNHLTILKVAEYFKEIASAIGKGSRRTKENLVQARALRMWIL
ncbi:hypothetical protein MUP77_07220 [Candidatus Bathyarchaeota archaeon]|nr:hypothetical protein [Candidatus Bathyarchaeota archaeon]